MFGILTVDGWAVTFGTAERPQWMGKLGILLCQCVKC